MNYFNVVIFLAGNDSIPIVHREKIKLFHVSVINCNKSLLKVK